MPTISLRNVAIIIIVLAIPLLFVWLFWMYLPKARVSPARTQSVNNLHRIGLAIREYERAHNGVLPSDWPKKNPRLSWRVMILPYIGEERLFREFDLEKDWDSPENRRLIAKMPLIYCNPRTPRHKDEGLACYLGFSGKNTILGSPIDVTRDDLMEKKYRLWDLLMAIESDFPVPWTKPGDLHYDADAPLPPIWEPSRKAFGIGLTYYGVLDGLNLETSKWPENIAFMRDAYQQASP